MSESRTNESRLHDAAFGLTAICCLMLAGAMILAVSYAVLSFARQYAAPFAFPGSPPASLERSVAPAK